MSDILLFLIGLFFGSVFMLLIILISIALGVKEPKYNPDHKCWDEYNKKYEEELNETIRKIYS
jgi:hypothetical protein